MSNKKKSTIEVELESAFTTGYANAAASLRKLTGDKVYFNNFHFGFHAPGANFLREGGLFGPERSSLLITTEVFGDLNGKSYLMISEHEFDALTREIVETGNATVSLKMEYAKELDNILSASVITALSNELALKIYGDIPLVPGKIIGSIEEIIRADFSAHATEVYVTAIYFSFESQPALQPFFIWVVDSKTLKSIETSPMV